MHVCIHAGMDIKICTDVYGMYMCICEHAFIPKSDLFSGMNLFSCNEFNIFRNEFCYFCNEMHNL